MFRTCALPSGDEIVNYYAQRSAAAPASGQTHHNHFKRARTSPHPEEHVSSDFHTSAASRPILVNLGLTNARCLMAGFIHLSWIHTGSASATSAEQVSNFSP